jgi:hypothetical protein
LAWGVLTRSLARTLETKNGVVRAGDGSGGVWKRGRLDRPGVVPAGVWPFASPTMDALRW